MWIFNWRYCYLLLAIFYSLKQDLNTCNRLSYFFALDIRTVYISSLILYDWGAAWGQIQDDICHKRMRRQACASVLLGLDRLLSPAQYMYFLESIQTKCCVQNAWLRRLVCAFVVGMSHLVLVPMQGTFIVSFSKSFRRF